MNFVSTFLEENRQRLNLDRYGAPDRLSYLMITPRFRASSHVVFLILPPGCSEPVLVAKAPRLAGHSASLEREAANLRAVHQGRVNSFGSIPRLVAFEEYGGRPILVQTALVGQAMDPGAVRRNLAGCCQATISWLINLQQPALRSAPADPAWFARLVEQPLQQFKNSMLLSPEEKELLARTRDLVLPLHEAHLPLVFEHGDLSHPNLILLADGSPGVVDWELADPRGLPTYDLFFFLTYAAFALQKASSTRNYLAAFHSAFFERTAWARAYVKIYAEQLGLATEILTPLFILSWVRYMVGLLSRLDQAGNPAQPAGAQTAGWLRTNRYYALWQHSLIHANELNWSNLS